MERRPRIFPKELVHFPRKCFQNKMPSVLLPCPPHRISPLWEQSCKARSEQVFHLSHQARVTETSSAHIFPKDAERASATQVLRHLAISSHLSHTDNKTMAVLLPCLYHQGLTKPPPHHKYHALATVMPFPRSNFRAKKTVLKLTADKQSLMPLPDHKNEPNSLLNPGYQLLDQSGRDHLPKIFPGYKNKTEAAIPLDQKAPSPTTPVHKAEVPLCEGEKIRLGPVCRPCLDSQTGATPGSVTTTQQTKASLRQRRNQVRAATMLLGFTKKGDRPTASTSSHCLKDWSRAKDLKPPDLAKVLKKSHSDLCPRNTVSLIGCANHESRSRTPSSLHRDEKKTGVTGARSAGQQAQVTLPMEVESQEEATPLRTDDQTTTVAGQDQEATTLLNQDSPKYWTTPTSVSETKDFPDPNIHLTLQAEQDQQEQMNEEIEQQAIIPVGEHYETTYPPSVPQDTSPDQWLKLTPNPPHQAKATQCLFAHVSVQTDQGLVTHSSVQTEQESWQTMLSSTDHQATELIGSDHGTTPPLGLNPKMRLSGLNHHSIPMQSPDHQVTGSLADFNPPAILQAGQDHLGGMERDTDLDQVIFFPGQDHGPLYLKPQDKILSDSDQATTLTGQDPGAIPPAAIGPQKKMLPEPGQEATSLTNPHHLAKETRGHLACVSVQKEHEPWEIMMKTDQQATTLIGQDCGTASLLGLNSKDTLQPGLDHQTTSPPCLDHQTEDLSVLGIQLMFQRKILPWEEITLGIHHLTTLFISQGPGMIPPFNLDPQDKSLPVSGDWVTSPSYQDNGITPLLALGPQNKTLPEPDSLWSMVLTSPHHPNQAIQDHVIKISVQTNQELWKTMPPRAGQQTTTLIGQDHGVTMPVLFLDTRDMFSPILDQQATFLPSLDHQAKNMPDSNVQFTIQEEQNSLGEMAQKTQHQTTMLVDQSHRTIPLRNLDTQDKTLSASDRQITTLRDRDCETTLSLTLGPQNKTLFQFDQQVKDIQSHVAKVFIQTGQKTWETMPPITEHQATATLIVQDYGTTSPVGLDPKNVSPIDLDYWAISRHNLNQEDKMIIDHNAHVTPQADLNHWETISQEKDLDHMNLIVEDFLDSPPFLSLDNQETTRVGLDHWDIRPPSPYCQVEDMKYPKVTVLPQSEQDHWESIPQGIEPKAITITSQAIPPLALGLQDQTLPLFDHQVVPQTNPEHSTEDTPDSDIHVCSQMVQQPLVTLLTGKGQQAVTPSDQDPGATLPWDLEEGKIQPGPFRLSYLSSADHQSEDTPASNVHCSIQTEQDPWKTVPKRKDPQVKAQTDLGHEAAPLMDLDQDGALTGSKLQAISSPSPYNKQVEDTQHSITHISLQIDPEPWETSLPSMDNHTTTLKAQNNKAILPVSLDSQNITLPGFSYQDTNMFSPEQQEGDIQRPTAHVLLETGQEYCETMLPRIFHRQHTALKGQSNGDIPLLSLDSQDKTLSGPNLQDASKFIPDQQVEPTPSSNACVPFQTEPKSREMMPQRLAHQVTSHVDQVNGSASPLSSVPWNPNQSGSDHQAIRPPVNPNHKPEVVLDLQTYTTAPSNKQCLPKLSMDFNHKVMSKSITNLKPRQSKQNSWCFEYIEPYTVNGTTISTEIMHAIISSIPQERIKNDISKQILLRRMKVSSTLQSSQWISSSYPICLICASWIPNDCPHVQRRKYSCEAQLLAIPTPLPSPKEEDMGVKFVLQTPQNKCFTFIPPEIYCLSPMPLYRSADSSPSSSAESMRTSELLKHQTHMPPSVPERIKDLGLLIDKYHQPGRTATFRSQQSLTGTKLMREYNSRKDQPRSHPIFFRSLLERFQFRQKVN